MALHKVHEPEQKPGFVIGQNKEHPRSQRISSRVHQAGSGFFQIYIWHTEISGSGPDCLKVRNQILQLAWSFRDMSCRLCPNSGHGLAMHRIARHAYESSNGSMCAAYSQMPR